MAGERLAVYCFQSMEEIVRFEGQNDHNELIGEVKFSKLELVSLPNLLNFYAKKEKMGSSSACARLLFNVKVIFPVLYELSIAGVGVIEIWDKKSIAVFEAQGSFCQLKSVYIQSCSKLLHVFSSKMHPLLKELGWLHVKDCGKMEGIVGEVHEDGLRNEASFSKLAVLGLSGLPNFLSFYTKLGKVDTTDGNSTIHAQPLFNEKNTFPLLQTLRLDEDLKPCYSVTKEVPIGGIDFQRVNFHKRRRLQLGRGRSNRRRFKNGVLGCFQPLDDFIKNNPTCTE